MVMLRDLVSASDLLAGFIAGSSCELAYRGLRKSSFIVTKQQLLYGESRPMAGKLG